MPDLKLSLKIDASVAGQAQVDAITAALKALGATKVTMANPVAGIVPAVNAATASLAAVPAAARAAAAGVATIAPAAKNASTSIAGMRNELVGLLSIRAVGSFATDMVAAATKADGAFKGLESTANRTGIGIEAAWRSATDISSDGVLSLADSAAALKNLYSAGFGTKEATQLIKGFTDAAAYGRQSTLGWAEAVVSATEGIKNENSALVDNAGLTRNVAKLYEDYAKANNLVATSLTQSQKVQAIMTYGMKEMANQAGDTAKAMQGLQGENAKLGQSWGDLQIKLGEQFTPTLTVLTSALTFLVDNPLSWMNTRLKMIGLNFAFLAKTATDAYDSLTKAGQQPFSAKFAENKENYQAQQDEFYNPAKGPKAAAGAKDNEADMKAGIARKAKAEADEKAKADAGAALKSAEAAQVAGAKISGAALERIKADNAVELAQLEQLKEKKIISEKKFLQSKSALTAKENQAEQLASLTAFEALRVARAAKAKSAPDDKDGLAKLDAELQAASAQIYGLEQKAKAAGIDTQTSIYTAGLRASKSAAVSRVDLLNASLDAEKTTFAAAEDLKKAKLEASLEQQLLDQRQYLEQLRDLQLDQVDFEVRQLETKRAQAKKQAGTGDASERAKGAADVQALTAEITAASTKRQTLEVNTAKEINKNEREILATREQLLAQIQEMQGDTFGAQMSRISKEREAAAKKYKNDPKTLGAQNKVFDLQEDKAKFDNQNRLIQEQESLRSLSEQRIQRLVASGQLTEVAGQQAIRAGRLDEARAIEANVVALENLAAANTGNKELGLSAKQAREAYEALNGTLDETATTLNRAFSGIAADAIKDLISGAQTFGDVLKNAVSKALAAMADVAFQNLAKQMFAGLQGAAGQGAGGYAANIGSAVAGFFGYSGGGYTGPGGKFEPAGIVHKDEFVFDKESTSRAGVGRLYALMRQLKYGYSGGGLVTGSAPVTMSAPNVNVQNNNSPTLVLPVGHMEEAFYASSRFEREVIRVQMRRS